MAEGATAVSSVAAAVHRQRLDRGELAPVRCVQRRRGSRGAGGDKAAATLSIPSGNKAGGGGSLVGRDGSRWRG